MRGRHSRPDPASQRRRRRRGARNSVRRRIQSAVTAGAWRRGGTARTAVMRSSGSVRRRSCWLLAICCGGCCCNSGRRCVVMRRKNALERACRSGHRSLDGPARDPHWPSARLYAATSCHSSTWSRRGDVSCSGAVELRLSMASRPRLLRQHLHAFIVHYSTDIIASVAFTGVMFYGAIQRSCTGLYDAIKIGLSSAEGLKAVVISSGNAWDR